MDTVLNIYIFTVYNIYIFTVYNIYIFTVYNVYIFTKIYKFQVYARVSNSIYP